MTLTWDSDKSIAQMERRLEPSGYFFTSGSTGHSTPGLESSTKR